MTTRKKPLLTARAYDGVLRNTEVSSKKLKGKVVIRKFTIRQPTGREGYGYENTFTLYFSPYHGIIVRFNDHIWWGQKAFEEARTYLDTQYIYAYPTVCKCRAWLNYMEAIATGWIECNRKQDFLTSLYGTDGSNRPATGNLG